MSWPLLSSANNQSTARSLWRKAAATLFKLFTRLEIQGLDHIPTSGPTLFVSNHISHLDPPLILATIPRVVEFVTLSDLNTVPLTGHILRSYGVIWVRRDELDRDVLKQSLEVLAQGRALWLAPEAGRSPTAALVAGRQGAAWLAAKSGAPIIPVGITGTHQVVAAIQRLRRPTITITFGPPFIMSSGETMDAAGRRALLAANTDTMMRRIAALLPPDYRGVYA